MPGRLEDKIALVTGASRGIGRATALALAREGAHVVITSRTEEDLLGLAEEIKELRRDALPIVADVRREEDVTRLYESAHDHFKRVDILVNNAGVGKFGSLASLTTEDYDWMMDTNMRASFLCTRAFLPRMLERQEGWIIFVGSVAGLRGLPHQTVFSASKHAQYGFAMALDYECHDRNVKVSYIAPGGVNSGFALGTGRVEGDPKLETYLENEDVAEAVVFALTQPPKSRIFLIGMRPLIEEL